MNTSCVSCRVAGTCSLQPSWDLMEASGPRANRSQAFQTQRCCICICSIALRIGQATLLVWGAFLRIFLKQEASAFHTPAQSFMDPSF